MQFEKLLRESEEQYRDLFEEAPIGYVKEDLQSRFLTANRAALRILGLKPEEVAGTVGMSFIAGHARRPAARPRGLRVGWPGHGHQRRRPGAPPQGRRPPGVGAVVVQAGTEREVHATLIVDITDRVLAESRNRPGSQQQNLYLQEEIKSVHNFEEIIGQSPPLLAVLDKVSRVAATDATVLITGETGTGKELIARAIHSHSRRRTSR